MEQRWNWFRVSGVAALLALLLPAPIGAAEKNEVTLGYSSTGPTAVGLWMAQEIGAFNKYAIEATSFSSRLVR